MTSSIRLLATQVAAQNTATNAKTSTILSITTNPKDLRTLCTNTGNEKNPPIRIK